MPKTANTTCSECGTAKYIRSDMRRRLTDAGQAYLCRGCRDLLNLAERAAYIQRWLRGDENGMRGRTAISRHIRRWLFERAGNKCEYPGCTWSERNPFTGNLVLEVHHLDGDHTNNRPDNLQVLCLNHHGLTRSFRACNRGNGRPRKA